MINPTLLYKVFTNVIGKTSIADSKFIEINKQFLFIIKYNYYKKLKI